MEGRRTGVVDVELAALESEKCGADVQLNRLDVLTLEALLNQHPSENIHGTTEPPFIMLTKCFKLSRKMGTGKMLTCCC